MSICPHTLSWFELLVFQALEAFKVQHDGTTFYLSHCWTIINGEEKFKTQYADLLVRGGEEVVEDHGDGEKARPQGKTNSKKEDKRDMASIALFEKNGGHDKQEGLEGGEAPAIKGRAKERLHGNPKEEAREGRGEASQDA
ncbi:Lectin-domain containing receptor kinase A4.3 [Hordeum vulgare]|nr:Lectin-domain containing receptor kinase A4.3 [Hordeum vulgare]